MESRAPLIYFEHAGKFEQMDGDCYDDDPADFPSVSWRLGGPQSEKGDGSQSISYAPSLMSIGLFDGFLVHVCTKCISLSGRKTHFVAMNFCHLDPPPKKCKC